MESQLDCGTTRTMLRGASELCCLLCNNSQPSDPSEPVDSMLSQASSSQIGQDSQFEVIPIKVEVDEEGQMIGWREFQAQERQPDTFPEFSDQARSKLAIKDLLKFLQSQFKVVTKINQMNRKLPSMDDDWVHFCSRCFQRLNLLHNLWAKLISIEKEFQKLSREVDAEFKETYRVKRLSIAQHHPKLNPGKGPNVLEGSDAQPSVIRYEPTGCEVILPSLMQAEPDSAADEEEMASPESTDAQSISDDEIADAPWKNIKMELVIGEASTGVATVEQSVESNANNFSFSTNTTVSSTQCLPCVVKLARVQVPDRPATERRTRKKWKRTYKQDKTKGGPFPCPYCTKLFKYKDSRRSHIRIHTGEKPYTCQSCGKGFRSCSLLIQHVRVHSDIRKYACHICDSKFKIKPTLTNHLATIHGIFENSYPCTLCSKKFVRASDLGRHLAQHYAPAKKKGRKPRTSRTFHCNACKGATFESEELLKAHRLAEHGKTREKNKQTYPCGQCKREFMHEVNQKNHIAICNNPKSVEHHRKKDSGLIRKRKIVSTGPRPKKEYVKVVCDICGRVCSDRSNLAQHIKIQHEGLRPYPCPVCSATFTASNCLKVHMVKHTGLKALTCDYCDARFCLQHLKRKHQVEIHREQYLTEEKPIYCVHCWLNLAEIDLPGHMEKIHSKFTCTTCNPPKVFLEGAKFHTHLLIHTGEKPFQCTHCAKSFNQRNNWQEHVNRHTGTRPHICEFCDAGFFRKKEMARHVEGAHGAAITSRGKTLESSLNSNEPDLAVAGPSQSVSLIQL